MMALNHFKKVSFLILLTCFFSFVNLLPANGSGADGAIIGYQHDMDIVRLNDLKKMGGYIEKYKENTGAYPFEGRYDAPLYAVIGTKEHKQAFTSARKPPYPHKNIYYKDFVSELEKGLGEKISLPFDPQRVPSGRQNFYMYMITEGTYFLAVHLYNEYSFAQKISENWFKVEVSNKSVIKPLIWNYDDLMASKAFKKAINEPLHKPDYIDPFRDKIRKQVGF